MQEYVLYLLTGAIFGALLAVVYQLKILMKMEQKILSIEKHTEKILNKSKKKKKSKK